MRYLILDILLYYRYGIFASASIYPTQNISWMTAGYEDSECANNVVGACFTESRSLVWVDDGIVGSDQNVEVINRDG